MSREIDRKVAEALGWRRMAVPKPSGQLYGTYEWLSPDRERECMECAIPDYSTDIAAAMGMASDLCRAKTWEWKIVGYDNGGYGVFVEHVDTFSEDFDGLPLAICAAILAAHKAGEGE